MLEDVDIPIGWRRLAPHEIRQRGDMFYSNSIWHTTSLIGNKVGECEITVIRALNPTAQNPNDLNFKEYDAPILKESASNRVKNYLKKFTDGK